MLLRLRFAKSFCEQVRLVDSGCPKIQFDTSHLILKDVSQNSQSSRKMLGPGATSISPLEQRQRRPRVAHQRRRSWSTQYLEYILKMLCFFGGLTEIMQLCYSGGGRHARMLLRKPGVCRTLIVVTVASHTLAVVLACCVVWI